MKKILFILSFFFASFETTKAQDNIKLILQACSSSSNTLDFDLILRNNGGAMVLGSIAVGIDLDYVAIGGGTLHLQYVDGSSELNDLQSSWTNKTSTKYSITGNPVFDEGSKSIRINSIVANAMQGTKMEAHKDYKVGTFKLTRTAGNWIANSQPKLTFVNGIYSEKTETKIIEYFIGSSIATTWNYLSKPSMSTKEVIEKPCSNFLLGIK